MIDEDEFKFSPDIIKSSLNAAHNQSFSLREFSNLGYEAKAQYFRQPPNVSSALIFVN